MSMTQIIALREKRAQKWDAAKAFLDYLTGPEAAAVFENVGFSPAA